MNRPAHLIRIRTTGAAAAAALLLSLATTTPAAAVERGPHPQLDPEGRITLVWRGAGARSVKLQLPSGPRLLPVEDPRSDGSVAVDLGPLPAGHTIGYTVATTGGPVAGHLRTPPAAGQPFTFAAYGDSRTDHRAHAALVARIAEVRPDVVLHTGDLVTRGQRDHEWAEYFEVTRPLWTHRIVLPVLGNHDLDGASPAPLQRHFGWPAARTWYAVTWGNLRLLALDSEVGVDDPDQARWAMRTVKQAQADPAIHHIVAFIHQGPYSTHPRRSGNLGQRPLIEALHGAGLDLIISGHDHYYERGVSDGGLTYLVLGGGGAPLYDSEGPGAQDGFEARSTATVYSFARVRVVGPVMSGCGVDLSGAAFDCFTLRAR